MGLVDVPLLIKGFWEVGLDSIKLGETNLVQRPVKALFDTGNPFVAGPPDIMNALVGQLGGIPVPFSNGYTFMKYKKNGITYEFNPSSGRVEGRQTVDLDDCID